MKQCTESIFPSSLNMVVNIMPLIPCGKMKGLRASTCEELRKARQDCEGIIPQFRRCEQCRADVI